MGKAELLKEIAMRGLSAAGLALVAGYVVWIAILQFRSSFWRRLKAQRTRHRSLMDSVRDIRQASLESKDDLEKFYQTANDVLRGLAAQRLPDRAGLTPPELRRELARVGDSEHHAAVLSDLLAECDTIRYAPDGLERARKGHESFVAKLEELTRKS